VREPARTSSNTRFEAERLAAGQPQLLLAALRVADTVTAGDHGRRRSGPGDSFWQFRHYQPGDSARQIDWRRSARSDPIFVRENEWEAAQSIWIWRDPSASMHYTSDRDHPDKYTRATLLLLALAALLLRGGEQVALYGSGRPAVRGVHAVARLFEHLRWQEGLTDPATAESLPKPGHLPRHAHLIMIGDFLSPLAEIEAALQPFAQAGVRGHIQQILDPAETDLPMKGRIRFEGFEDEGDLLVRRVDVVREEYRQRMRAHQAGLLAIAHQYGWTFGMHHTDQPPTTALLALHAALSIAAET
jgi:uncharacterized protein (DUF58 family)